MPEQEQEQRWTNPKSRWTVHETIGEWPDGTLAYNLHQAEGMNEPPKRRWAFDVVPAESVEGLVSALEEIAAMTADEGERSDNYVRQKCWELADGALDGRRSSR